MSSLYKLESATIAGRLKKVLDKLISDSQCGFIKGRFIGESTRLVYDLMHYTESKNIDGLLMLIDFEKAFDSISWKFMYKTLEFLGFGKKFVNWIKLFNNKISASVLQVGIKSESFNIKRGCKQGDPIAPYLFIICSQILNYLINEKSEIKGIKVHNTELKMTQFADDTTLFLDGSTNSLLAALNTIELFGTLSGLKMNTSKTKVVWIGRKKHSREKINVSHNLEWGIHQFRLLGIHFSTNLDEMPMLNYSAALKQCDKLLMGWKKRNLTPFGKITIIKTFILSKFNHIFTCLPSPSAHFCKSFTKMLYDFLWDNKPDKIKRIQILQDYKNGGLRMVNIENFIHSLKLTWIKRLFVGKNSPWVLLSQVSISDINNLIVYGSEWGCNTIKKNTGMNQFWKDVLLSWVKYSNKVKMENNSDILAAPIWYNPDISQTTLFFPQWFKHGITYIGDLIKNDWSFLSELEIEKIYGFKPTNFLEHFRLKTLCDSLVKKHKNKESCIFEKPCIPKTLSIVFNKSGAKPFYNILNGATCDMKFKTKWNEDLGIEIEKYTWEQFFTVCFKTVQENELIWFQYRLIHRILGTQRLLYKMGIVQSELCLMCQSDTETLKHLFCDCSISRQIWNDVRLWIASKTGFILNLSPQEILLGYTMRDQHFLPVNTIIMVVKSHIFSNSRQQKPFDNVHLHRKIKKVFEEQRLLSTYNQTVEKFSKSWAVFNKLFT